MKVWLTLFDLQIFLQCEEIVDVASHLHLIRTYDKELFEKLNNDGVTNCLWKLCWQDWQRYTRERTQTKYWICDISHVRSRGFALPRKFIASNNSGLFVELVKKLFAERNGRSFGIPWRHHRLDSGQCAPRARSGRTQKFARASWISRKNTLASNSRLSVVWWLRKEKSKSTLANRQASSAKLTWGTAAVIARKKEVTG